jgi:hypothetical protein
MIHFGVFVDLFYMEPLYKFNLNHIKIFSKIKYKTEELEKKSHL